MTRNYYFPTINGYPGIFTDNGTIAACAYHGGFIRPVATVQAVKRQIRKSIEWDKKNGMPDYDYNFVRIVMEVEK